MKVTVAWQGVDEFARLLRAHADEAPKMLARELYAEAQAMMADSQLQVPVDTGVLRGSGTVGLPTVRNARVDVELGYGGAAEAYALVQHEREDYQHTVGKAKYLVDPVLDATPRMVGRISEGIVAQLRRLA